MATREQVMLLFKLAEIEIGVENSSIDRSPKFGSREVIQQLVDSYRTSSMEQMKFEKKYVTISVNL